MMHWPNYRISALCRFCNSCQGEITVQ